MKNFVFTFPLLFCFHLAYNQSLLLKGGLNYANLSKASVSQFNSSSRSGWFIGGGLVPGNGFLRFNSEILYSKQGYDFKNGNTTGKVDLQYLLLPQTIGVYIGPVQIHAGLQFGFLLNSQGDTTSTTGTTGDIKSVLKQITKLNFSAIAGAEFSPVEALLIGIRYNHALGNILQKDAVTGNTVFAPDKNLKSNLLQLYVGLRFKGQ